MLRLIHSFNTKYFNSFDELEEFIDNLGDSNMFICQITGYTPISLLKRYINKNELKNMDMPGRVNYYKLPEFASEFKQLTYRSNTYNKVELDLTKFKSIGVCPIYPYMLSSNALPHLNNSQVFEWGDSHGNNVKDKKNFFTILREFEMSGFSFGGTCKSHRYYKIGFNFCYSSNFDFM